VTEQRLPTRLDMAERLVRQYMAAYGISRRRALSAAREALRELENMESETDNAHGN